MLISTTNPKLDGCKSKCKRKDDKRQGEQGTTHKEQQGTRNKEQGTNEQVNKEQMNRGTKEQGTQRQFAKQAWKGRAVHRRHTGDTRAQVERRQAVCAVGCRGGGKGNNDTASLRAGADPQRSHGEPRWATASHYEPRP